MISSIKDTKRRMYAADAYRVFRLMYSGLVSSDGFSIDVLSSLTFDMSKTITCAKKIIPNVNVTIA